MAPRTQCEESRQGFGELWDQDSCKVIYGKRAVSENDDSLGKLRMATLKVLVFRAFCGRPLLGAKKSTQTFFVQSLLTTLRVMEVRAENRGRPHQKVRFSAAPVVGRNFLTPGHPGVRVRNVRGKSGPKSLCLCCFFYSLTFTGQPLFATADLTVGEHHAMRSWMGVHQGRL